MESISNEDNLYLRFLMVWVSFWEHFSSVSIFTSSHVSFVLQHGQIKTHSLFSGQSYWEKYFEWKCKTTKKKKRKKWKRKKMSENLSCIERVFYSISVTALFLTQDLNWRWLRKKRGKKRERDLTRTTRADQALHTCHLYLMFKYTVLK